MKSKLIFLLTLISSTLILSACNQPAPNSAAPGSNAPTAETTGKTIATAKAGEITVTLANSQGHLTNGQNDFTVEFRNAAGQPVDVGAITMFIDMPAMGSMAYMKSSVKLMTTNTPGIYQASTNLDMGGTWYVNVSYKGAAGEGQAKFSINAK